MTSHQCVRLPQRLGLPSWGQVGHDGTPQDRHQHPGAVAVLVGVAARAAPGLNVPVPVDQVVRQRPGLVRGQGVRLGVDDAFPAQGGAAFQVVRQPFGRGLVGEPGLLASAAVRVRPGDRVLLRARTLNTLAIGSLLSLAG